MAFGNILFGGIIGAGVDASTGAAYDYPSEVILPMQCSEPGGSETDSAHNSGNATVAAANAQGSTFGEQPSGAGSAISASVASSSLTANQSASNLGAATQAATATSFKLGLKAMEVPVSTDQTGQIRQAVTVTSVDRGGSADNASLKVNDVLISINGEPIRNLEHLKMLLGKHSTSQQIYITVMRDTSFFSTYVKAAESQL